MRKLLSQGYKSLTEKGYVDVTKRYIDNAQQSNIYTVRKIQTIPTSKFVDEQYKPQIEKQDSDIKTTVLFN